VLSSALPLAGRRRDDAGPGAVRDDSGAGGAVDGGASRGGSRGGRGARVARARGGRGGGVSGVWDGADDLRSPRARVASPRHLPARDAAPRPGPARRLSDARGAPDRGAVGHAGLAVHRALRAAGDRLAAGGRDQRRRPPARPQLGRGVGDHAPRRDARPGAAWRAGGAVRRGRREVVPAPARLRDGRQRSRGRAGALRG